MQTADLVDRLNLALASHEPLPQDIRIDLGADGVVLVDSTVGSASLSDVEAPLSLTISLADCAAMLDGQLSPMVAVLSGRLTLTGDMVTAMHLYRIMGQN